MKPTIIGYYRSHDNEFQIIAALLEHPQAPLIAALQHAHPGRQLIVAEQQEIEYDTELVGKVLSWVMAISMCSQPIGQAMYGVLFEQFAGAPGVVILGAAAATVVVALYSKSAFSQLEAAPAAQA